MLKSMRKVGVKGFSLVELMVVVAIIGILAAVAIPNFQRFQRKARSSEGKTLLAGYFTAEKAFYAEWDDYGGDFMHIGYAPTGQLRYQVHSGGNINPTTIDGYTQSTTLADSAFIDTGAWCANAAASCVNGVTAPAMLANRAISAPGAAVGADAFVAVAAADIGGADIDERNIDEEKMWTVVTDGTLD